MNTIIGELGKSQKFVTLIKQLEQEKNPVMISGLTSVGMVEMLVGINEYAKKPLLLVTYNEIQAKELLQNIKAFTDKGYFFPKKEIVTYDYIAESKDLPYERIEVLNKIKEKRYPIIITTIEALMQKIPPKEVLFKDVLHLKIGDIYNLDDVKRRLINLGYVRCDIIEGRGQFSIRGGILDISITDKIGVRIEFWGDEIDSIRNFAIISQRSINTLQKVDVYPAHEYILETPIENVAAEIKKLAVIQNQKEIIEEDLELIAEGNYISKIDKYFDCFYSKPVTLLDYISEKYIIAFDDERKIEQRTLNIDQDRKNLIQSLIEKEKFVPQVLENNAIYEDVEEQITSQKQNLIYLEKQNSTTNKQAEKYIFDFREVNYYKSETENLFEDIKKALENKKNVYILVETKEKAKKLKKILEEENIITKIEENLDKTIIVKSTEKVVTIGIGKVTAGFENYEINQLVLSADELISGENKKKRTMHSAYSEGEKVVFADLKIGDYVVHRAYGIGIYIGVNTIKADGTIKDYIKIKYQDDAILYVPTNQMDAIRKYVGGDKIQPKLNKLGSKDWEKAKNKVKKNLREVAKELIELYAKREKSAGYAFNPDTPWQAEFESDFPYQETDDQLRCIDEVKKDMETNKPMDRLLCGDVGYGKTEVAIRAAFKAVMDHKQVAYLAPTTVLAEQQYQEFKERMKDFPIKVEILNRFKTPKYQKEVIKKLKLGEVDIVVGTHRLLSKDVEFKDLGLLIIDEEHRFGVKAKEKIKEYKTSIDVLTMTATPIPRTLHMSIVGVRDMSVIYEPPHNRRPVQTYVLEYDMEVVKEAITKELERNGQVFYIFNNVKDIQSKADEISKLVPEAIVNYAHGQMTGKQIEDIMQDFVNQKSNVLVCTTILESGIDIPNANTIIVENADKMGLAQLYQIRGRVGRSDRQAYAYITYKRDKLLSEVADKRLKAIKEFTEFGSGFKIAMRDLEIRGAGSLLGEIQSGHLEQVGYDTYCNLLDEVVKEMQGVNVEPEKEIQIDLNVTSYIPDEYIPDSNQKIEVYQDIALCKNEQNIQDIVDEIIDRFGNMPKEVENLLDIARIKYLAKDLRISKIGNKKTLVTFTFDDNKLNYDILKLVRKYNEKLKFSNGIKPMMTLNIGACGEKEILKNVTDFLKLLKSDEYKII